jgi:tetratricopeptide (TPR) repeat protein
VVRALRRGLRRDPAARWPSLAALCAELAPRSRAPWAFAALAGSGIAGGIAIATSIFIFGGGRDAGDPCRASAAKVDEVWNGTESRRVTEAFAATGLAHAADASARVIDALDTRTRDWASVREETCRARADHSDELYDLKMRCLDVRLAELDGLVETLAAADVTVIERSDDALAALTPLAACDDADALRAGDAPPDDPALRARVDELEAAVGRVRAARLAGRRRGLVEEIDPLVAAARETGWSPLLASALHESGLVLTELYRLDDAATVLREAATESVRARDDLRAAKALIDVAFALEQAGHADDALQVVSDAELLAARVDADPALAADLLATRGRVLHALSRLEEADAAFARAIELLETLPDEGDLALTLGTYAGLLVQSGRNARAVEVLDRAITIAEARVGPYHPKLLTLRTNRAAALLYGGDPAAAIDAAEAVIAIDRQPAALQVMGNAALLQDRNDDADRWYAEAIDAYTARLGGDHPRTLESMYSRAVLRHYQGRSDESIALHQQVLDRRLVVLGENHAAVADSLDAIARVYAERDDGASAEPYFERALAIRTLIYGADARVTVGTLAALARAREMQDHCDDAVRDGRRALPLATDDDTRVQALIAIVPCLLRHRPHEAKEPLEQLIPLLEATGATAEQITWARGALAEVEALAGARTR